MRKSQNVKGGAIKSSKCTTTRGDFSLLRLLVAQRVSETFAQWQWRKSRCSSSRYTLRIVRVTTGCQEIQFRSLATLAYFINSVPTHFHRHHGQYERCHYAQIAFQSFLPLLLGIYLQFPLSSSDPARVNIASTD